MDDVQFEESDAWLLHAVLLCRGQGTREKIVVAGDYLERAVFTKAEFDGGMRRLMQAKLVHQRGDTYEAAAKVKAYISELPEGRKRMTLHEDSERVRRYLGLEPGG